jgi:hypothetical protein
MENGQCTLCGERGHLASECPDLCSPLKEGFQGGGGGGGEASAGEAGCGGDEDAKLLLIPSVPQEL